MPRPFRRITCRRWSRGLARRASRVGRASGRAFALVRGRPRGTVGRAAGFARASRAGRRRRRLALESLAGTPARGMAPRRAFRREGSVRSRPSSRAGGDAIGSGRERARGSGSPRGARDDGGFGPERSETACHARGGGSATAPRTARPSPRRERPLAAPVARHGRCDRDRARGSGSPRRARHDGGFGLERPESARDGRDRGAGGGLVDGAAACPLPPSGETRRACPPVRTARARAGWAVRRPPRGGGGRGTTPRVCQERRARRRRAAPARAGRAAHPAREEGR